MSKRTGRVLSGLIALTLVSAPVSGQERRAAAGGPPPYNIAREVTVTGTVIGTEVIEPGDRPPMTVLTLTVSKAEFGVFLGPADWVSKQNFAFTKGAAAQVTGMTGFKFKGLDAVTARTVKVGTKTLELRDATGKAKWEGAAAR